jgi:ABC-2 type transport system ATP-binding protein
VTPTKEIIVSLKGVAKTFTVFDHKTSSAWSKIFNFFGWGTPRKIQVLRNINLEISKGEFIGVIGKNGSGKSTLLHIISGSIRPDSGGMVNRKGNFIRLSLGMGFNPELSARQNVFLNASILGVSLQEIRMRFDEIIAFAELENFAETQLKFFSNGMRARLAFAVAILLKTDLLLMDEFFGGVGDEAFKQKANSVFNESLLQNKTCVLVSHNMETIKKYCNRVYLLNDGNIHEFDDPEEAVKFYRNTVLKMSPNSSSSSDSLDP